MTEFWKNITSPRMEKLDKNKSLVMLPTGAIEQHGPHLPVGTDSIILEKLMERFVAEKSFDGWNVLVAPPLFIGKSNEHMDFSGTLTYSATTYYNILHEIAGCIAKHGFKKLLLTNAHGGNTDMLNLISRDIRIDFNIEVYVFDWWFTPFWQDILKTEKESESPYGVFHACELETSLIMALAGETVDFAGIADETPDEKFRDYRYLSLFGPVTLGWRTRDMSKSGVIGSPVHASAEKGRKFMTYAVDKLAVIVEEIIRFSY
jgi:creatinine amidohydrolase